MRRRLLSALGVLVLTSSSPADQPPGIEHQPVGCVVAGRFPQFDARFVPSDAIAKARVLFQAQDGRHWYAVAMKPEGSGFAGVLPKPTKSLKAFRYYIEVVDKALGTGRTAEYTTAVVAIPGECQDKMVAVGLGSASVTVQVPAGAPSLPAGFSPSGLTAAGAAGAATAAAGAATGGAMAGASAGGGIPAAVVIGAAGAAAAGVAVAVVASGTDGTSNPAAGNYVLERLAGSTLPALLFDSISPRLTGFTDSGTLRLEDEGESANYEMTVVSRTVFALGPPRTESQVEIGRWSGQDGGVITFTVTGGGTFNPSSGMLTGSTLTLSMDVPPIGSPNTNPPRRVEAVWRKQ